MLWVMTNTQCKVPSHDVVLIYCSINELNTTHGLSLACSLWRSNVRTDRRTYINIDATACEETHTQTHTPSLHYAHSCTPVPPSTDMLIWLVTAYCSAQQKPKLWRTADVHIFSLSSFLPPSLPLLTPLCLIINRHVHTHTRTCGQGMTRREVAPVLNMSTTV